MSQSSEVVGVILTIVLISRFDLLIAIIYKLFNFRG
jgi:hypothetical protein